MIYGNDSISHYTKSNVFVWMAMAFQAGILNVGGFMACHRFVSHVTGFAVHFGIEVNHTKWQQAFGMLIVPLFFLIGSMISGIFVDLRLKQHKKPKYYFVFGIMFLLLQIVFLGGVFGFFGPFGDANIGDGSHLLLIFLCLICGMQNGTVTTVSKSVIRTTHLTGITTDLGLGLMRIFYKNKIKEDLVNEVKANWMRIGLILFFVLGSTMAVYLFERYEYWAFFLPVVISGCLLGAMLFFQIFRDMQLNPEIKSP